MLIVVAVSEAALIKLRIAGPSAHCIGADDRREAVRITVEDRRDDGAEVESDAGLSSS